MRRRPRFRRARQVPEHAHDCLERAPRRNGAAQKRGQEAPARRRHPGPRRRAGAHLPAALLSALHQVRGSERRRQGQQSVGGEVPAEVATSSDFVRLNFELLK